MWMPVHPTWNCKYRNRTLGARRGTGYISYGCLGFLLTQLFSFSRGLACGEPDCRKPPSCRCCCRSLSRYCDGPSLMAEVFYPWPFLRQACVLEPASSYSHAGGLERNILQLHSALISRLSSSDCLAKRCSSCLLLLGLPHVQFERLAFLLRRLQDRRRYQLLVDRGALLDPQRHVGPVRRLALLDPLRLELVDYDRPRDVFLILSPLRLVAELDVRLHLVPQILRQFDSHQHFIDLRLEAFPTSPLPLAVSAMPVAQLVRAWR